MGTWFHGLRDDEQRAWLDALDGRGTITAALVERLPNRCGPGGDDAWVVGPSPAYWLDGHHSLTAHNYYDPGGGDFHLSPMFKAFLRVEADQLQSH